MNNRRNGVTPASANVGNRIARPRGDTVNRNMARPTDGAALLRLLRQQRRAINERRGYFSREDAPDLFALAEAADRVSRGRDSFNFRGVRFELRFGFRRYVVDPETGDILVGGGFLV